MLVGIAIRRVPKDIFDCGEVPRESSPATSRGADIRWATVLSTPFPATAAGSACSVFFSWSPVLLPREGHARLPQAGIGIPKEKSPSSFCFLMGKRKAKTYKFVSLSFHSSSEKGLHAEISRQPSLQVHRPADAKASEALPSSSPLPLSSPSPSIWPWPPHSPSMLMSPSPSSHGRKYTPAACVACTAACIVITAWETAQCVGPVTSTFAGTLELVGSPVGTPHSHALPLMAWLAWISASGRKGCKKGSMRGCLSAQNCAANRVEVP